ncbi:BRCT domain-containing protein [Pseudomonas veronii]|jgi:NAD-dependent DNA ligase|uniref:BRCT domain-containing protein n=1 Tax=Pseudomonas TaxID=286 RepID=UPI000C876386|nr:MULTISPECIES: BRCT domain-containing protein [Pseudomonas]PMU85714.1 NAD-dependent DNA ligase [Pseudomonas sp. GW704-F3]PMU91630.1 NAD-dependent DNA ligase [Pseudomonas sp. GW704-F5]PMV01553.1 NAD-dependent DNA ligase [Pseudomonas sp. MPBD4-3]PMV19418.1 NAD-dependent DNA ligase [Pseudomonas sp. GW704-F2]UHH30525.1 BRCT domain-containing protein [Pseudomonas veronii]
MDLHNEFENSKFFHRSRIDQRAADALVGLAAGITADGVVNTNEALFLKQWLENNLAHLNDPVINLLYSRLASMLQDNALDPDESLELLNILRSFSGVGIERSKVGGAVAPTDLPFNSPAPDLIWDGRMFVFTGVMAFGPRKDCQALVEERGGLIGGGVSKKVHYLVVGSVGNEQWRHSTYGTKIMKAVELREAGASIAIVGEDHWQKMLFG